ncbi:hypothetical protein SDC9_93586 [bioreactor metagenome]|uniref:Bacterial transcriptional activator domain-containing protein n=1 Tax=bioreactor metagenome TaxID=1076179 RepID=A0A645A117_9ZZZZ
MKKEITVTPMKTISVTLLGGFSLELDGVLLTDEANRSQKLWSVLAYLIVHRNRSIPQSEFIDVFWPENDSDNPANALKTLLYRIRAMLEPLFGAEIQPILSQRGSYSWNRNIACKVDVDRFEALTAQGEVKSHARDERADYYAQAIALYRDDLLPKLADQIWLVSLSTHYHTRYIKAVKELSALLCSTGEYQRIVEMCARASQLDPLDEELHILLVRSYLRLGNNAAALSQYEQATELLYRNLGVRPSDELRQVYTEIMAVEQCLETDLEVIQKELKETAQRPGAFVCEYGFFREVYRLEVRRARRSGTSIHIGLITISLPDGGLPSPKVLSTTMDQLSEVLTGCLRRGDVVSKYSAAQYVVLLPSANFEDSNMVMERIISAFYRQHRRNFLKLSAKIRELEPE